MLSASAHASPTWAVSAFAAAREAKRKERDLSASHCWQIGSGSNLFFREWTEDGQDLAERPSTPSTPSRLGRYAVADKAVAVLAPAAGQAPTWKGPMVSPKLVRGSRTELASPSRPERSVWPYKTETDKVKLAEVPLFYSGAGSVLSSPMTRSAPSLRKESKDSEATESRPVSREVKSPVPDVFEAFLEEQASSTSLRDDRQRKIRSRGGPLGMSDEGGWIMQLMKDYEAEFSKDLEKDSKSEPDEDSPPVRAFKRIFPDAPLPNGLPPVVTITSDGRCVSAAETMCRESLRTRVDNLHWSKNMVTRPPVAAALHPRQLSPRPGGAAFERARQRSKEKRPAELAGRVKSEKLLVTHFELRRAGQEKQEPPARVQGCHPGCLKCQAGHYNHPPVPVKDFPEGDGSMILRVISSTEDTAESLEKGIDVLANSKPLVGLYGGARHPTSLISFRTLDVIRRKLEVVVPITAAVRKLEELCANKGVAVTKVLKGASAEQVVSEAWDIQKKLDAATHPGGKPQDQNRSDFEGFVRSFRLPSDHHILLRGWNLVKNEAYDWADVVWETAQAEVKIETDRETEADVKSPQSKAADTMKRIVAMVASIGVDIYRPQMEQTDFLLRQARGAAVNRFAEAEAAKDNGESNGEQVAVLAAKIEYAIKLAEQWGVEPKHPELLKAKSHAHKLRAQRAWRYSHGLLKNIKPGVLGSAGKVADQIDEAIEEALTTFEVPRDHKDLVEVREWSLKARSDENKLKRKEEQKAKLAAGKTSG